VKMSWAKKVFNWNVKRGTVFFYDKEGKILKEVPLDDIIKGYLYLETEEW